jgi:hypothetical protein
MSQLYIIGLAQGSPGSQNLEDFSGAFWSSPPASLSRRSECLRTRNAAKTLKGPRDWGRESLAQTTFHMKPRRRQRVPTPSRRGPHWSAIPRWIFGCMAPVSNGLLRNGRLVYLESGGRYGATSSFWSTMMHAIADALVYAVSYINCRSLEDDESRYDDGDVGALESIAGFLQAATAAEEDALAAAAERALASAREHPLPRPEFIHDYERWMEDIFSEGWQGNRRVPRK